MNRSILSITPSDKINRQIWRWINAYIPWSEVEAHIASEVDHGRFHPDTDPQLIMDVALDCYSA